MTTNEIIWITRTNSYTPIIRFNQNGEYSFNSIAQKNLSKYVRIGIDKSTSRLFLRSGTRADGVPVATQPKSFPELTRQLAKYSFPFPSSFYLAPDEAQPDLWVGTIHNQTEPHLLKAISKLSEKSAVTARQSPEMEDLLSLYHSQLKKVAYTTGRSIPFEDRFMIAQEGFIDAVLRYKPNFQVFQEYIIPEVRAHVKSQISLYSSYYKECIPLEKTSHDGKSSYSTFSDPAASRAFCLAIDEAALKSVLSELDYAVYQEMTNGLFPEEIMTQYHLSRVKYGTILKHLQNAIREINT